MKPMFTAAILLALILPHSAKAQRACAPRDAVVQKLAEDYGESRQSIGLGHDNSVVEVFASLASGSWTITVTRASGLTCLVASGQGFETLQEQVPAQGAEL